jgi:hypothetical protein
MSSEQKMFAKPIRGKGLAYCLQETARLDKVRTGLVMGTAYKVVKDFGREFKVIDRVGGNWIGASLEAPTLVGKPQAKGRRRGQPQEQNRHMGERPLHPNLNHNHNHCHHQHRYGFTMPMTCSSGK